MDPGEIAASEPANGLINKQQFQASAHYVGERIDVRAVTTGIRLASRPLTVSLETGAIAIVFGWGAIVFLDAGEEQIPKFLDEIRPLIWSLYPRPETEAGVVRIEAHAAEGFDGGLVTLHDTRLERLQILANVLGKTVALAQYEADIATSFDKIEPFALELEQSGLGGGNLRELLRHIGRVLLNEHKLLGRVEVAEKPDLLWEHHELDSLYARLEAEYELSERAQMLDRKLELISRTVRTVLDLLQHRRSLRVEWYIVILIVVEIALSLYDLFLRR
jgi:uncharacterized Rmd1/YagE family protein